MASGDTMVVFTARNAEFPDEDWASSGLILVASSDEPDDEVPTVNFDPGGSPNEHAEFMGTWPDHYDSGGLNVTIIWSARGAASGVVRWEVAFKRYSSTTDTDTKAYNSPVSGNFTAPSVDGELDYATIAVTRAEADNIQPNQPFRMRLTRDAADAADTMNGNDAELIAIEIRES
jgi:hypothetical protein